MLFSQKNPQAIRLAEERRGLEQLTMSAAVNLSRAWQLSSHIHNMCSEAREAVYVREADIKYWLDKGNLIFFIPETCTNSVCSRVSLFSVQHLQVVSVHCISEITLIISVTQSSPFLSPAHLFPLHSSAITRSGTS